MRPWLLFWIIVLATSCIAEFDAVSEYTEIKLCQGGSFTDTIKLSNLNTGVHEYSATADYTLLNPTLVTLQPQFSQDIINTITAPQEPGRYEIYTTLMEDTGDSKILKQTIEVIDCSTIIAIDANSFSNCQCSPTLYMFNVYNNEPLAKPYSFSVDATDYTISAESAVIEANGKFPVYVYVNLPCDVLGQKAFTFTVATAQSTYTTEFFLNIRDCYDYTLNIGNTRFCDEDFMLPVEIFNTGELRNNYTLSIASELFSLNETISLEPEDSWRTELKANTSSGQYPLNIEVLPSLGNQKIQNLSLKVGNCFNYKAILIISLIFLAIIIIVLLLITLFRKKSVSSEKKTEKTSKKWLWWILAILILILLIWLIWKFAVLHWIWKAILAAWAFFTLYILYFAIGIVAALLIILVYWRTKYKAGIFFWLVVFLGVCFLLLTMCFFTGVCKFQEPVTPEITEENSFVWKKDKVEKFDMSKFINNPDKDELNISYTPVDNISIQIDKDFLVYMTPDMGWTGERTVNFILDDGRGGRAVSPDIVLVVLDQESYWYDPITSVIGRYFNYIFAALLICVIIVILLVLKTQVPRRKLIVRGK